ncbi:hypothetical protein ACFL54_05390 [Planctomycetota bacterium]
MKESHDQYFALVKGIMTGGQTMVPKSRLLFLAIFVLSISAGLFLFGCGVVDHKSAGIPLKSNAAEPKDLSKNLHLDLIVDKDVLFVSQKRLRDGRSYFKANSQIIFTLTFSNRSEEVIKFNAFWFESKLSEFVMRCLKIKGPDGVDIDPDPVPTDNTIPRWTPDYITEIEPGKERSWSISSRRSYYFQSPKQLGRHTIYAECKAFFQNKNHPAVSACWDGETRSQEIEIDIRLE